MFFRYKADQDKHIFNAIEGDDFPIQEGKPSIKRPTVFSRACEHYSNFNQLGEEKNNALFSERNANNVNNGGLKRSCSIFTVKITAEIVNI